MSFIHDPLGKIKNKYEDISKKINLKKDWKLIILFS